VSLLSAGLTQLFEGFFSRFNYLAPFTVLILCGLGAPLPEEVALIGSGLLLHQGEVEFVKITLVCSSAILLGDSLPFWLGRRYGLSALKHRWVARVMPPDRIARTERRFAEHGNWVVFTCRFLPGIRIPGYFFAGTMGMSFGRFMLLDSLGVLISVPASIYIGKLFGESVEMLQKRFDQLHLVLAFLVVSILLIVAGRAWVVSRERRARAEAEDERLAGSIEAPGPGDGPVDETGDGTDDGPPDAAVPPRGSARD
jgi:membrane protein DedA with SNARE-associated domain